MERGRRFGAFVRQEREKKQIGLREMAKIIGVSPTYLSMVERDVFPPPAEDKVKAIAKFVECDGDDMLARAGRVSTDISDIIKGRPIELAALLRTIGGFSADDIVRLTAQARAIDRRPRLAVHRPESVAESRKWLRDLADLLEERLHEYTQPEESLDARYLRWFVEAARQHNPEKSLDELLGLKNLRGRPKSEKPGKHFGLAYKMFLSRSTKSSFRSSEHVKLKPKSWKEVGREFGISDIKARKIVEQELPNVIVAIVRGIAERRKR